MSGSSIAIRGGKPEACHLSVIPLAGQVGVWIDDAEYLPIANVKLTHEDAMEFWEKLRSVLGERERWAQARAKVDAEGQCRACGTTQGLQAAHIIPRSRGGNEDPRNICPLCITCHSDQHAGRLELLPLLDRMEQAYAAEQVGLAEALRRTTRRAA